MARRRTHTPQGPPDRRRSTLPAVDAQARPDTGFRPWHFFVLASLVAATGAVVLSRGAGLDRLILVSLAIGAAGAAGLGFYRTVAPLVAAELGGGAEWAGTRTRAALEREKTLVLRAIKELEFDRAMGKIAPRDFEEMVARLRARAVALMKQLDQAGAGYRDLIERELLARLGPPPVRGGAAATASPEPVSAEGSPRCGACGTTNDEDARFCKRCGSPLSAPPAAG